jgi:hypothetical protein
VLLPCWFDHFLDFKAEICQMFRCFFGKSLTPKRHSEINWPSKEPLKKFLMLLILLSIKKKDTIIIKCTQSHYVNASQCCRSGLKSHYKLIKFRTHLIWFLTLEYQNWGSSGISSHLHSCQLTSPPKTYKTYVKSTNYKKLVPNALRFGY